MFRRESGFRKGLRRAVSLLTVMTVLSCAAGVPAWARESAENSWYIEKADVLREKLREVISFDFLAEMYSPSADTGALLGSWAEAMEEKPLSVKGYPVPPLELISEFGPDMKDVPQALTEKIGRSLPALLISQINGMEGVNFLAAANIPTLSEGYLRPEGFAPCIVIYEYEGICVCVSFTEIGEGVVLGTAQMASPRMAELLTAGQEEEDTSQEG